MHEKRAIVQEAIGMQRAYGDSEPQDAGPFNLTLDPALFNQTTSLSGDFAMPGPERHEIKASATERFFNHLMGFLVGYGIGPRYMRLLQVRGRKSGRIFTTPVNLIVVDGRRYLVAARGDTAWSRNARVSGEVTLKRGANLDRCRVVAIPDADKPPVLKAFLDAYASQVQRFFPVKAGSPAEAFREMAPQAPVFELQSVSTSS